MLPFSGMALAQGARLAVQAGLQQLAVSSRILASTSCSQQAANLTSWQQPLHHPQQQLQQQQQQQTPAVLQQWRHVSSSSSSFADGVAARGSSVTQQQQQQRGGELFQDQKELDALLQVLLQPVQSVHKWNSQLSPYLIKVNDQMLYQPQAVLLSVVRALHVIRGMLQQDAHIYVVGSNKLLRPLVQTAAKSCINPNVWFQWHTWSPGTLTNYASHNRLFKEAHQPNRRLFAAKGYKMVNPLCPEPPPASAPLPRLSWDDKWLLFRRTRRPGYRQLLQDIVETEDTMHKYRAAGSVRGTAKDLRLMVFLDSVRSAVAIKEAYIRNIPTIAIANSVTELKYITYPVLARDFHAGFVHFFLDWIVKVANAAPNTAPKIQDKFLKE